MTTPLCKPTPAMIEAHRHLLTLPGVRADPAKVARIRELLRSWGVDPDAPAADLDVAAFWSGVADEPTTG